MEIAGWTHGEIYNEKTRVGQGVAVTTEEEEAGGGGVAVVGEGPRLTRLHR